MEEIYFEQLIRNLSDPDSLIRLQAVNRLGSICDERVVVPLHALLNDPDPKVRAATGTAIESIQQNTVVFEPVRLINVPQTTRTTWAKLNVPFMWDNNGWPFFGTGYLLYEGDYTLEWLEERGINWRDDVIFGEGYLAVGSKEWYGYIFALYAQALLNLEIEWCGNLEAPFFLVQATSDQITELTETVRQAKYRPDIEAMDALIDSLPRLDFW